MSETNSLITALALGVFVLVIGAGFAVIAARVRRQRELLEVQAAKRNGAVKGSFPLAYPRLTFLHNGREVVLYLTMGSRNTPPHASVRAFLANYSEARLSLRREGPLQQLRKWMGAQDIELGDPNFDNTFIVEGQLEVAQQALNPAAQQALLNMASWQPKLSVRGSQFSLIISRIPGSEEEYDRLIDTALGLLERVES
jgi:hypothetical protein